MDARTPRWGRRSAIGGAAALLTTIAGVVGVRLSEDVAADISGALHLGRRYADVIEALEALPRNGHALPARVVALETESAALRRDVDSLRTPGGITVMASETRAAFTRVDSLIAGCERDIGELRRVVERSSVMRARLEMLGSEIATVRRDLDRLESVVDRLRERADVEPGGVAESP